MKIGMKTEHFRQSLSSQNIRNDVLEHDDFKVFLGEHVSNPSSGSCLWCFCDSSVQIKETSHFTYSKRLDTEKENRVIDAWHEIQYFLPRAITVMHKRNIYIICNQFRVVKHVNVQCRTPFTSSL